MQAIRRDIYQHEPQLSCAAFAGPLVLLQVPFGSKCSVMCLDTFRSGARMDEAAVQQRHQTAVILTLCPHATFGKVHALKTQNAFANVPRRFMY